MNLKQKLKNNELTIGSWIMMGNSMSVEVMALAGFDWLVVDIDEPEDFKLAELLHIHKDNL